MCILERMAKHHRDRSWAPAPKPLAEWTIDNHTHVRSVVPFSQAMSHEAAVKGQPPVPVYSEGELLDMAAAVGICKIVDVGCEYPNLSRAVSLAEEFPDCVRAALAIHPNEAVLHGHRGAQGPDGLEIKYKPWHDIDFDDAIAEVHRLAVAHADLVVAIGETGLDFFRTGDAAREHQREAFRAHIALAKELNLPMQIHDRDAHADCIDILLKDGSPDRTVFHSYSGDAEMGRIARDNGWYLSFSGTVSYKGNDGIRESLRIVGLDHAMVETDAPYLTPMPYRGRTNAPYMIPYTLRAMADTLDLPIAEVARGTRATTRAVYGI